MTHPAPPTRSSTRGSSGSFTLLVVAALALAGGLGYGVWSWYLTPQPLTKPLTARALSNVCPWPRNYFPKAPAYDGSKPHPMMIMYQRHTASGDSYTMLPLLTTKNTPLPDHWNEAEKKTQLVACLDRTDEGQMMRTCHFDNPSSEVPLYASTYELAVYEARTGEEVMSTTIPAAKQSRCPSLISYTSDEKPKIYATPTVEQLKKVLVRFTGT